MSKLKKDGNIDGRSNRAVKYGNDVVMKITKITTTAEVARKAKANHGGYVAALEFAAENPPIKKSKNK